MQEIKTDTGAFFREFFEEDKDIQSRFEDMKKQIESLGEGEIKQVETRRRIKSNDKCPCNSGKKFKRCCMNKVK